MRNLWFLIISFVACCLLWTALLAIQIGKPREKTLWMSEAHEKKEAYAKTIKGPKIAILGGSNALFGFDSKMLEEHWQTPVANMAVAVGLGMDYLLERSKKSLKQGDIVLMPLEYELYQNDGSLTSHYASFLLGHDTGYFHRLSFSEKAGIFVRVDPSWVFNGLVEYSRIPKTPLSGVYGIHNINERGDQINIDAFKMPADKIEFLKTLQPEKYLTPELSRHFITTMDGYIRWAGEAGICLIVVPPGYLYFPEYKSSEFTGLLENIRSYYAARGVSFVGNPYDYMYNKEYFYNSWYHLNSLGVERRSAQLLLDAGADLRALCQ